MYRHVETQSLFEDSSLSLQLPIEPRTFCALETTDTHQPQSDRDRDQMRSGYHVSMMVYSAWIPALLAGGDPPALPSLARHGRNCAQSTNQPPKMFQALRGDRGCSAGAMGPNRGATRSCRARATITAMKTDFDISCWELGFCFLLRGTKGALTP